MCIALLLLIHMCIMLGHHRLNDCIGYYVVSSCCREEVASVGSITLMLPIAFSYRSKESILLLGMFLALHYGGTVQLVIGRC